MFRTRSEREEFFTVGGPGHGAGHADTFDVDSWDWAPNEKFFATTLGWDWVPNEKFFGADLGRDLVLDVLVLNGRDSARIEKFFAVTLRWDLALNMPNEMLFDVALGRDRYKRVRHGSSSAGPRR